MLTSIWPGQQNIWLRAGDNLARLKLGGIGHTACFTALRTLSQGGGLKISRRSLIEAALTEFPNHERFSKLLVYGCSTHVA